MDATATRDRSRRAVRAAVVVAAEHGLSVRDATVLKDGSNLTVELIPAKVVARVATNTGLVREAREFLARELDVAGTWPRLARQSSRRAASSIPARTSATG